MVLRLIFFKASSLARMEKTVFQKSVTQRCRTDSLPLNRLEMRLANWRLMDVCSADFYKLVCVCLFFQYSSWEMRVLQRKEICHFQ